MSRPVFRCQKREPGLGRARRAFVHPEREAGFSLVELLVVMLIIGLLAAIALPIFYNQRGKANDTQAKSTAHVAQIAMETCASQNGGSYANCDSLPALSAIQATLIAAPVTFPEPATFNSYRIRVASPSAPGQYFEVDRGSEGLSHPCATAGKGGCPSGGDWAK